MLRAEQQQSSNTHSTGPLTLSTKTRFQRLPQQISQICLQIRFFCLLVHSLCPLYVRIVPLPFLSPEISHLQGLCRICVLLEHRRLKRRIFGSDFSVFFPAFFLCFLTFSLSVKIKTFSRGAKKHQQDFLFSDFSRFFSPQCFSPPLFPSKILVEFSRTLSDFQILAHKF